MERILIIDDDVALCELLTEYLAPEGFQVESAHDGETGLEKAEWRLRHDRARRHAPGDQWL